MFEWILNFLSWNRTSTQHDKRAEKIDLFRKKCAVRTIEAAYLKYKSKKELYAVLDQKIEHYLSKKKVSLPKTSSVDVCARPKKRRRKYPPTRRHISQFSKR